MVKDGLERLRKWFVVHFVVDMIAAIPMMMDPQKVIELLGLVGANTLVVRMVAAALMAIGTESYFGRKGSRESFVGMLRLKIIWSSFALLALFLGVNGKIISMRWGWFLIVVFGLFNLLWWHWFFRLKKK